MAKILITDDAAFMRGSLKYIVEGAGHSVVGTAKDGQEALKLCGKLKPDIVTLDILMSGMDGLAALKAIKKEHSGVKVVMVTALGQEEKQEEAFKSGASGYIIKPFKQTEIVDEIRKVLASSS
jgi:two-component system chemotaxis response regulator CheY